MIATIQARFVITDEEALYIKEVTEEKTADLAIPCVAMLLIVRNTRNDNY